MNLCKMRRSRPLQHRTCKRVKLRSCSSPPNNQTRKYLHLSSKPHCQEQMIAAVAKVSLRATLTSHLTTTNVSGKTSLSATVQPAPTLSLLPYSRLSLARERSIKRLQSLYHWMIQPKLASPQFLLRRQGRLNARN